MANRPQPVTLPLPRTYSRTEFTALRARVKGLSIPTIIRLYFDRDTTDPLEVERLLRTMREDLTALALREGSPVLIAHLRQAIAKYGEARFTPVSLQLIEQAAGKWATAAPQATHSLRRWFRPLITDRLMQEGISTLDELVTFINRRGGQWWRSMPRIGANRARALVKWLRHHAATIGQQVVPDVDTDDTLAPKSAERMAVRALAPLERLVWPQELSGQRGINRAQEFSYIRARHDLDAVRAYLHRYDDRPSTQRAYTRELERLVLWSIIERGVALSSLTVEDCDAYKAFLAAPSERFIGPPSIRTSDRWRPFAPGGLSPESQRYAVRVIRTAFSWLADVRYLAGNPWRAITDPLTVKRIHPLQVGRALPIDLWQRMREALAEHAAQSHRFSARWRAARALLLIIGDSGLRIAEATAATRTALSWLPADNDTPASWLLNVIGKGNKERVVPISDECAEALRAHWQDRGQNFDAENASGPLVAPLVMPATPRARAKYHGPTAPQAGPSGYSVRGAYGLTRWAIRQLLEQMTDLSEVERRKLASTSPHAFRHTVGTQMLASGVALEVVQRTLGHASLNTTSIYISPEETRLRREAAKYHAKLANRT